MRRAWIILLLGIVGCNSQQQQIKDLTDSGEVALGGNQYDKTVADADEALHLAPTPLAYYLRGRAEEDRPKPDSTIESADLSKAKADYQAALALRPETTVEARCRAGLANIAFSQGDYSEASYQWNGAIDNLDQPDLRANALYRIGECEQRLGRFDDADRTFARVVSEYPDEDVAAKAQARLGVRGFYVQVGAFASTSDAQSAIRAAEAAGLRCRQYSDQGLIAVRGGPYTTYSEAQIAKDAVAGQFTDAVIGP
jgi:tetratricopeptide (TPR) repeat protein